MGAAESRVRPSVWLVEACASLEPVEVDEVVTLCRRAANAKGQPETSSSCPSNSTECALYVLEHERTLGLQTHHDCSNITDALRDAFATPPMVHAVLHRLGDTISTRGDGFVTGNDSSKNPPVGVLGKLLAAIASCKRAAYGNKDDALVLIQAVLDTCASQVTSLEVTDKTKFFERLIEELAFSATRDTALLDDDATNKFLAYLALDGAKTYFASGGSGNSTSTVSSSKKNHRNQFRDTVSRSMYDASLPSRRGKLLPKLVGVDGETSLMTEKMESPLLALTAAWFLGLSCPSEWRVKWRRVFDSTKHGASFVSFLNNTKNVGPTLVLIQTKIGYVLGGLTSLSLKSGSDFFGDEKSFVFSLGKLFGAEESSADDASSFDFGVHRPTGVNSHFCYCAQGFTSERFPNGVGFGGQIGHFSLFLSSDFERGHARHTAATFGGVRLIGDAHASSAERTGALLSSDDGTINQDGSFEVEKVVAYAVDGDFAKRFLEKNVMENRRGAHGGGGVLSQKYAETRMLLDVARRDAGGAERQDR